MSSLTRHSFPRFFLPLFLFALFGCQDVIQGGDQTFSAPGPVKNTSREVERANSDITSLGRNLSGLRRGLSNQESRIEEVRKGLQTLKDELEKDREKISSVSMKLEQQIKELRAKLDTMDNDLTFLRSSGRNSGAIPEKEELDVQIRPAGVPAGSSPAGSSAEGAAQPQASVGVSKETLIAAGVPQGGSRDVVVVVPPVGMPAEVPQPPKPITPNSEDEYNEALRILNEEGNFPRARSVFNRFITKNPTHERADDAQFWIGESYFREKNFERAILAFNKVQVDYANGDKAPDALLKEALAFLNLGDKASARELLARVIQKYPNSSAAEAALERLKSL
ncbi:MAG: tol-pal system protein YbgF [Nitrospinaceae bacterium]|jgi:tol-pal system protein YbgF|nr:tol-pal system protein YbgF [Nitrospinaceae bacterium]MBT3433884.1 tol-pal system protein YbgF [Nitrospinaceae bacterium]MBT3823180.1 tol-pal system protein YbgF [Nitrospinaceae bacterium]MBT4093098.1 tol-pal system protein YbgF [Nitrospinaceae bacterium]MBT4429025.1 tol-pal system protein YbgF [Nitrospinaceae bacterium]